MEQNKFRVLGWIGVSKAIQKVMEQHVSSVPNGIVPSCLSCEYFIETPDEICDAYKQRPPARVIAFGCPTYKDKDPIPF